MFVSALERLLNRWKSYKHRFVPWVVFNISKNEKTLRQVKKRSDDKLVPDEEVSRSLQKLFSVLLRTHGVRHADLLQPYFTPQVLNPERSRDDTSCAQEAMFQSLGFCIDRRPSSLASAGTGVFVSKGFIPTGVTVALYPGTIYQPNEPILLQSIRNSFVFRCIDGVLVDGNDKGISRMVFKSCSGRDRMGPFPMADISWLTDRPINPMAMGQYVNNCSNHAPANVCYQEYDVPSSFPIELHQFLPNVNYSQDSRRPLRCVALVSLRDITAGEELFSNYYTIVH